MGLSFVIVAGIVILGAGLAFAGVIAKLFDDDDFF